MAHAGTAQSRARKAKAELHDVDTREVSTVDRPAIGETFVIVKSEDGMAAGKKGAKGAVRKEGTADGTKAKPSGEPDAPAAIESAAAKDAEDGDEGGVSMALPPDDKQALIAGLSAASDRIADLLAFVSGATEDTDEGAEVPSDFLVKVLDLAGGIAKVAEPFVKGQGMVDDTEKATWSTDEVDKLPDSSFLYVEPGGKKDAEGKTEPRSLRHFPVKDADGKVDLAHLRNAIAQAPKSNLSDEVKTKVQSEGRKLLDEAEKAVAKAGGSSARCTWTQDYINSLCDWNFLYVEPGTDRDTDYHTLPLTNRHFPIRDHAGRLCLAAVLDALDVLAQPSPALAPWLTEEKRLALVIRLAQYRIDEVEIAVRRDGMSPESGAELSAIAEMLEMVASTGAPAPAAAPAEGAAPVTDAEKAANMARPGEQPIGPNGVPANADPTGGTPPKDVPQLAQKAAMFFRAVAKAGHAPMTPEHHETLKAATACMAKAMAHFGEAQGHLEKTVKAVDAFYEGKLPDANTQPEFGKPPVAGAPSPTGTEAKPADAVAQPADAGVAKALAEVRKELGVLKADNAALRSRVAKAERRPAGSQVNRDEPAAQPVAKSSAAEPPLSMDLNAEFARQGESTPAAR